MKAVAIVEQGSPAQLVDVAVPTPEAGQVLIRLQAAGVNPFDGKLASGVFGKIETPFVPGADGAGVVESLGAKSASLAEGDRVFGRLGPHGHGTWAEYVITPETAVMTALPDDLDPGVAAAIPVAGLTALGVLTELALRPRAKLLVLGATGGVGSFLVQLAARQGLEVIATARQEHAERVRRFGAKATIDHTSDLTLVQQLNNLGSTRLDGLVDLVGDTRQLEMVATMVQPGGKLISTAADPDVENLASHQITASHFQGRGTPAMLDELAGLAQSGELKVPLDREIALAQGPQALEESTSGHMHGKTIIRMDG